MAFLCRRRPGVMVRDLDGDVLILDTEANRIHQLNPTASYIWRHVDEARIPEQLAGLLAEVFDVEEPLALIDVLETLRRFQALNLVLEA